MDFTDSSHKLFGELQFHLALVVTLRLRNIADHRQGVSGLRTTKIVKIDHIVFKIVLQMGYISV